jgi:hypothetical protein
VARRRAKHNNEARRRKLALWRLLPSAAQRRRIARALARGPAVVTTCVVTLVLLAVALGLNWTYQVIRKPSELFFPVSGAFYKEPRETWRAYGSLFERHSTPIMTPDLLAALAQVEGSGNPVVRTYWRFALTAQPFEIYRPASSAVGMYQITDGTFAAARRYCIRRHRVAEEGPWYDFDSCWFNELYMRTVPSHAIEMTSAYLDEGVRQILARHAFHSATLQQQQTLATLMHLCGAGAATQYARFGLELAPGARCGTHDARSYLKRVREMQRRFGALAAR